MLTRSRKGWELPESAATPESVYLNRRQLIRAAGAGAMLAAMPTIAARAQEGPIAPELYPAPLNDRFEVERELTPEEIATTYNNFFEFGSHKNISMAAQALQLRPWTVTIDGMVEEEITLDAEQLIRQMPIEERLYRHRCVEAWSMTVPWTGFRPEVPGRLCPTAVIAQVSSHDDVRGQSTWRPASASSGIRGPMSKG